jgi:hypothetical protein
VKELHRIRAMSLHNADNEQYANLKSGIRHAIPAAQMAFRSRIRLKADA